MNLNNFTIYPAIHLRNGEVVRFTQGDTQNPIVFHTDPVACAQQWIDQGASWLQVINLDAAFDEEASNNWDLVEEICKLDVNIQFGGGIRSLEDVHWAMRSGIKRVIIGTAAVENPRLMANAIAAYGSDAIVLSIDTDQQGQVKIRGWQAGGSIQATSFAIQMRQLGVTHAIHTSIHLDGSMTGVDLQASIDLASLSGLNITVGGGIGNLDDVLECYNNEGIIGVIIGKALYTGNVDLQKALSMANKRQSFADGFERWKADQNTLWGRFNYQLVEDNLKQLVPFDSPSLRILDAGGGNGLHSLAFARLHHDVDIVDLSQPMLDDAKANAALAGVSSRIHTHAIDILDIAQNFPENHFDIVLCHNVIQFIDELEPVLDVLYRVLRPGGFLSLITANQYSLLYQSAYLENDLDKAYESLAHSIERHSIFGVDIREYRADELISWLENRGYSLVQHYGLGCLYFYWDNENLTESSPEFEKLRKLEIELSRRTPYKHSARYFQLIVRKEVGKNAVN